MGDTRGFFSSSEHGQVPTVHMGVCSDFKSQEIFTFTQVEENKEYIQVRGTEAAPIPLATTSDVLYASEESALLHSSSDDPADHPLCVRDVPSVLHEDGLP